MKRDYGFDPEATVVQNVPGYWPPHPSSATPNPSYRYGTPLPRQEPPSEALLLPPIELPTIELRSVFERVLEAVMRVIVIITCVVILYVIWRGYVALSALGDQLEQLRAGWDGLGG